ncbi:ATP-dependent zinc protease family protein [Arcobacter peruensis]|uniref:ATP-dependent zinc protease family protein n=1 Tax=Arcobacter peruensis TaxID=2320140 RepID=UPI000F097EA3|nr:RimK/LysX family protein [Arcobacter peruensis]
MFKFIFFLFISIQFLIANSTVIGKYDRVDLPLLKLKNLRAKVDTGAKTSSLHCMFIKQIEDEKVEFDVLDKSHKKYKDQKYIMPIKRIAKVRSSNGIVEKRYVISTEVIIFNKSYEVEFTLRDRKKMSYPILLGREFLEKDFIVDVRKKNLSFIQKNKK